jgi:hypothetical protein
MHLLLNRGRGTFRGLKPPGISALFVMSKAMTYKDSWVTVETYCGQGS